ncbi:MAG: EAL domain-containing protein [Clostridia bacterium]|nr:EAL domain-containing protein [Clostridia bacterium]
MRIKSQLKARMANTLIVGLATLLAGALVYYYASKSLIKNLEDSLIEIAKQGAVIVETEINGHLDNLETVSNNQTVKNPEIPLQEKLTYLDNEVKRNHFKRMSIADTKGVSKTTDGREIYIGDREYFKKAVKGERNISDPIKSRIDGTMVIVFAVPIYDSDKIIGVLYATHNGDEMCKITDNIRLGGKGYSFIINKQGVAIAHYNRELVYSMDNSLENVKKDPKLKKLVGLINEMIQGKTGAGEYIYNGQEKYMGYAPIKGTRWFIAVSAPKSYIFKNVNGILAVISIIIILVVFIAICVNLYTRYLKRRLEREITTSDHLIHVAKIAMIQINIKGEIKGFNKYAEEKTHYAKEDILGQKTIFDITERDEHRKIREILEQIKGELDSFNEEFSLICKHGGKVHFLWDIHPIGDAAYIENDFIELTGVDISQRVDAERQLKESHEELTSLYEELTTSQEALRKQYDELSITQEKLLESEERYQIAVEGSNDAIWDWNVAENKIFYSDKFYEVLGYEKGEIGSSYRDIKQLYHPEDLRYAVKMNREHRKGNISVFRYECRLKTKNGSFKWLLVRGRAVKDEQGKVIRMAGSLTDISERKDQEQVIKQLAYYDSLTGLPNRIILYEATEKAIQKAVKNGKKGALAFIDLDNFKMINDSFGHSFGDLLLMEIGTRLVAEMKYECTVSRLGGDEFIILVENLDSHSTIQQFANQLMDVFSNPFTVSGTYFYMTVSIGISIFPDDTQDVETLLKNADMAMYRAKRKGKRGYAFFDKTMNDAVVEKMNMESSLRKAIENEEFILYYQPQIDLIKSRIYGFEALIRWISPEYGFVPPLKFIDIAEDTGLIIPIGKWVLETACRFNRYLHEKGFNDLNISVNISVVQLNQDDFVDLVVSTLEKTGLEPQFLEIEITESVLMESIEPNLRKLEQLKALGIKILLDDFGTGYSSLSYLKQLPISTLKIDKSFIDDIGNEKDVTESIVHLAHKMGLDVVAEGVETEDQLNHLIRSKCNFVQGYLISKPVPEEDVVKIVNRRKLV